VSKLLEPESKGEKVMNEILKMAEEKTGQEGWKVTDDGAAEWALVKLREEENESKRIVDQCQAQIDFYQSRIRQEQERLNHSTGFLKAQLLEYFGTVPHKKTKTQESYKLPSGTLKLKYPKPEYQHDDKVLLKYLQDNDMRSCIKTVQSPKWGEIRKTLVPYGDKAVTPDGEILEGVKVVYRPSEFKVEV
jgi:hypothetical protein